MPDPTSDNPQTLRANDTPSLVDDNVSQMSPTEYYRQQEDNYNNYLAELRRKGVDFKVDNTTGQIKIKSGVDQSVLDYANTKYADDPVRRNAYIEAVGGDSDYEPDPIGSQYLTSLDAAETAVKRAKEDAAAAKALGGSVRSYMDTESDKTAEITRQFKDFDNRASLLYDLMDAEQQFSMNADDQNIQNWKAQKDLGMAINPGGYYTTPYQDMSLSGILRPSLPDYVRPDYRLNGAVGLPGPQGFDDPDYNSSGLPMYAQGTEPWPWPARGK